MLLLYAYEYFTSVLENFCMHNKFDSQWLQNKGYVSDDPK